ncbi:MAG: OsmC family peroxiredoxin, partial [Deltaproteobacteria bacterium]|nr:OsmC family peroxiredoxin [Deltaproteobacteria bacterium]
MDEIIKKVVSRAAKPGPGSVPGSLQPHQDRELRVSLEAESLDGMKKRAIVTLEQPEGSTFSIICDEGAYLAGEDTAPPPLA